MRRGMTLGMRRLLLVLVALGLTLPLLDALGPAGALFYSDHATVSRTMFGALLEARAHGSVGLWHFYLGGGEPLAAIPSALAWSPLTWLLHGPGGLDVTYDLFVAAHVPLAAASAYLFARAWDASKEAAILGALVFAASGVFAGMNHVLPLFESATFGPLALAAALTFAKRRTLLAFVGLSVALALHVMTADPAFLFCDAIVFLMIVPKRRPEAPGALGLGYAAAVLLAVGLVAVQWIPLMEALELSPRASTLPYEHRSEFALMPTQAIDLLSPGFAGRPVVRSALFGERWGTYSYLPSVYLGAAAFPIALQARKRWRWLLLVFFVVVMLGDATFVHRAVGALPGLGASRFPIKYGYGALLVFVSLVVDGFDRIASNPTKIDRAALVATGALALVFVVVLLLDPAWTEPHLEPGMTIDDGARVVKGSAALGLLFFGAAAAAVTLARRAPQVMMVVLVLLVAADLGYNASHLYPTVPREELSRPPLADTLGPNAGVIVYERERPHGVSLETLGRMHILDLDGGLGARFGIRHRFDIDRTSMRSTTWLALQQRLSTAPRSDQHKILSRLGIDHVLVVTSARPAPGSPAARELAFVGVNELDPPMTAFHIRGARGLVAWACGTERVASDQAVLARLAGAPRERALVTDLDHDGCAIARTATVADVALEPEHVRFTTTSSAAGLAVVAQNWAPGWSATVDGADAPLVRAELGSMAVPLEPGTHAVELTYRPDSFEVGRTTSSCAILIVVLLAGLGLSRRRRAPGGLTDR